MKVGVAAAAAVIVTGVTAPSAMGAAVLSDRQCYRENEVATFFGTGFQPGQPVAVSIDGQQIPPTLAADGTGRVVAPIRLGSIASSERTRGLSMTQTTNPVVTAMKAFRVTKLYVVTKPSSFRPGRRLRIRAGGFYGAGPTLYGHVRGPKKRNLRIGKVKGDCGKVSATKKVILKRRDSVGLYTVQFDTARRFRALRTPLQFGLPCETRGGIPFCVKAYTIRRILKFSRASSFASPVFSGQAGRVARPTPQPGRARPPA